MNWTTSRWSTTMPPEATEHDLEGLLEGIGIDLAKSTDWEVYGYCPGHEEILGRPDRNPTTWSVSRGTGNHFCFSCGYGGTLIDLILEHRGGTAWAALGLMREHGIDPAAIEMLPDTIYDRRKVRPAFEHMDERALDAFVDPPRSEARRRRLTPSSLRRYGVRWDGKKKCWITPIRLPGGALLGYQEKAKRFFNNVPDKVPKSRTLFGLHLFDDLPSPTTAILVESPLDCCRIYAAGFEGAVSSFGVYVSEDQMRALTSVTDEVVLALDNDDSGRKETHHLISGDPRTRKNPRRGIEWPLKFADFRVYNYGDSDAKDPGEQTDDEIEWGIEHAVPALEWSMT